MRDFVRRARTKPRILSCCEPAPLLIREARCGDGVVFLDLGEDEYSCRYQPENPISGSTPWPASASDAETASAPSPRDSRWTRSECPDHPRPAFRDFLHFFRALVRSIAAFRGRTLRQLGDAAERLTGKKRQGSSARAVADLFQHMLAWSPVRPKCLFESFFLLHFLDLYGIGARWFFGVQLFPFRAHCWIAVDGELLNEVPHAIENYEIIWTVGGSQA